MRNLSKLLRRAGALAATAAALGAAAPAAAQIWTTGTCGTSGCHTQPPTVQNNVPDGGGSYVLGLGESWMSDATALRSRVTGAGVSAAMNSLTVGDANLVFTYLKNVRDGVMGAPSATPSFSSTTVGASSNSNSFSFTLTNFRNTAVNYAVGFTGTHGSDFSVQSQSVSGAGCSSTQLPATGTTSGSACTVTLTLRFTPGAAGPRSGNLRVTLSGLNGSDAVPLDGTDKNISLSATGVAPTPGFQISTTTVSQTAVVPSTTMSADITITNPGSATGSLTLSSLVTPNPISGGGAAAFSLVAPSANACTLAGQTLAPGASCNIAVRFNAATKGAYSATLSIPHNATGSPQLVSLSGTAQQGTVSVASPIAVGNVPQGSTGSTTAIVTNSGDSSLTITSKAFSGTGSGEFGVSGCTAAVAPAGTCTLTVSFTPTGTTPRSVTLALTSGASNSPTNVTVTATGTALANPTVSSVAAFPSTLSGTTSGTTRTVTITNTRTNPLDYAPALSGTNGGDFAIGTESCPTRRIAGGGGSCDITLTFTPSTGTSATARTGSLDLSFTGFGTDPSPAAQAVALAGTAQIPAPTFSIPSSTLNFAATVGTPATTTTTITNTGTAALTLNTLTFGGTFVSDYAFAAGNTCTAGLSIPATAGSNTCTLAVQFNPASASPASRGATLTIAHNATGSPQVLTLSGTATAAPQPSIDLGAATRAFGSVPLGSTSSQTVTVSNIGAAPLVLSGIGLTGAAASDFTRGGTCTATSSIAVGGSCTITLLFAPAATGTRTATLAVTSNASNTPSASVALSGDGVALADPVVTPATIDAFPSTLVGSTSATTRTVTITNPRANTLSYARTIAGANAADFAVAAESCPTRVVPGSGGSCTITLQYAPLGAGARSGTLNLTYTGFGADPSPAGTSLALAGTAALPAPTFSIASSALTFSAVVGTPGSSSTLITNTGSAALTLSSLTFSGVAAAEFSLAVASTCAAGTTLAPSSSCTLAVAYAPAAAGTSSASLVIAHNAAGSPQTVTLTGTATPAPQGRIALGALSLTFPDTQLGSPAAQNITVQNTGDAPLNFSAFTVTGAASADFTRGGSCAVGTPLAVAAQCTLGVTFRPSALGSRSATLAVQSDASNGTVAVSLAGTGVPVPAPAVTLSTASLDFGPQTLGGLYPTRSITFTNSGTADLTGIAVAVQGTGFTNAGTTACPSTLAPGGSCVVEIAFTPTAQASYTGTLSVTSNADGSPHVAALLGSGTAAVRPVLVWSPVVTRLDFGSVAAGTPSATQTATLLNQGPGGVTLTLLNAVGANSAAFSVTAGTCVLGQPMFEGQSCTIDVVFAPGSAGAKTASVQVASSGSFPPELALAGTGLGGPSPGLALSAKTLAFDAVRVGTQSLPSEVTITGSGSGVVNVTALSASGPYTVQMKSCPALPFSLAAGASCTVNVSFNPQAEGAASGKLTVTSDADPATLEVALSGNGEPKADLASGGCSIASGDTATDPTLWLLLLAAVAALLYRRRARRNAR